MKLNIWRFTDGKSGHDAQSNGLCIAINELLPIKQFDLSTDSLTNCLKNLLFKEFPMGKNLPDPDIIIGAGHGTHLTMLTAKYIRKGKTIVLMKPSLPFYLFDICIIPKHDCPPKNKNIIETTGALNSIKFNKNKIKKLGLILIGGPSSHYQWDSKYVSSQIVEIISTNTDINWTIADSPRTPKNLMSMITTSNKKNTNTLNFNDLPKKDIKQLIYAAEIIWVSPDSVSMIFEALTSGASVGLLDIKENRKSRIHKTIKHLISNDHVTTFISWKKRNKLKNNNIKLNEARRCATILLNRGLLS
jgi:mitochondrial fission protein ELM1